MLEIIERLIDEEKNVECIKDLMGDGQNLLALGITDRKFVDDLYEICIDVKGFYTLNGLNKKYAEWKELGRGEEFRLMYGLVSGS